MRTTLLLAALTLSLLPSSEVDACGDYGAEPAPQVLRVSTHGTRTSQKDAFRPRSFVVLGPTNGAGLAWTALSVSSYDYARIANVPGAALPMELTLVDETGTRTVKTTRRVALDRTFTFHTPRLAAVLEQPAGEARFAVVGTKPVSLLRLEQDGPHGFRVAGTTARTTLVDVSDRVLTEVFVGDVSQGRYPGQVVGAIRWSGKRFVLVEHEGAITPVRI